MSNESKAGNFRVATQERPVSLDRLVATLNNSFEKGLTDTEANARRETHGRNILFPKKKSAASGYLAFLKEPMLWLLIIAALVYWLLGETLDAIITGVAVIPVGLIDVVVDVRTQKALEQLHLLREPRVTVVREGHRVRLLAEDLVPGDHIIVKEGDIVMADAAIVESSDVKVDESTLTGESVPVEKNTQSTFSDAFFGNHGTLFAGTRLLMGRADCLVVKTGQSTAYGKVGAALAEIEPGRTKLQKDIDWIVTRFGVAAVGLSVFLILLGVWLRLPLSEAILGGVSLAIAAIPEEVPVVFTLFLTLGMLSLAKNKALVRRLPAVEALGSVNVVCTDKTGTLTSGKMTVVGVYTDNYYSSDEFLGTELSNRFLLHALMACEKDPFDYMEQAIHSLGARTTAPRELEKWTMEKEYPFDQSRKLMSHIWRHPEKEHVLSAKGAVESILELSNLDQSRKDNFSNVNEKFASSGARILGLAYKPLRNSSDREHDEAGLTFAGLIIFSDPLRPGIAEAVAEAQSAGVRVVMLTGDHRSTADAIAHQVGLNHDRVVDGSELDRLNDASFIETVQKNNIFCRVLPEQKLRIVSGLQQLGQNVAVTGDGINDAPALKKADIGIAMGEKGTEVAKQAASMILLDDNFGTIVNSIMNGRRIYENLQSAFNYIIAFHVPIFLAALIVPLLDLPLLLVPIDIVLLELVLHPVVSIIFQAQPASPNVMRKPPRNRSAPIINLKDAVRLAAIGTLIFTFSIASYYWAYTNAHTEFSARGLALATMIIGQTVVIPTELGSGAVSDEKSRERNKYLIPILLIVPALLAGMLYIPILAEAVKVAPFSIEEWAVAAVSGAVVYAVAESTRRRLRYPRFS